jgi:hypothetical protein
VAQVSKIEKWGQKRAEADAALAAAEAAADALKVAPAPVRGGRVRYDRTLGAVVDIIAENLTPAEARELAAWILDVTDPKDDVEEVKA